jgi:hypothetical protein
VRLATAYKLFLNTLQGKGTSEEQKKRACILFARDNAAFPIIHKHDDECYQIRHQPWASDAVRDLFKIAFESRQYQVCYFSVVVFVA